MARARGRLFVAALVAVTAGAVSVVAGPAPAAMAARTLIVNSVADASDANVGDGICSTAQSVCTLRAAIQESEAPTAAGHDTIGFAIPGAGVHRIEPQSAYPLIRDAAGVTIDGYTQMGSQPNTASSGSNAIITIELRGLGGNDDIRHRAIDGFDIRGAGSTIRGLAMFDFRRDIRIYGPGAVGNVIVGNFIGTDASASFASTVRDSSVTGVQLEEGARSNLIGRAPLTDRNVISGTADKGISLYNDDTDGTIIRNNVIGLAPDGVTRLANLSHGIDVNTGASDTIIGGLGPGEGNVISGNVKSGVEISHDSSSGGRTERNLVLGNLVGTTADGAAGTDATRNGEYGINFEGKASCVSSCTPDIIGNQAIGNVIVGSSVDVIIWKGANQTLVQRNWIGVLPGGGRPASAGSTEFGVAIRIAAFDNIVDSNVIAWLGRGIHVRPDSPVRGDGAFPTYANTFTRNSIHDIDRGLGIALYAENPYAPGTFIQSPLLAHPSTNGGIGLPTVTSASTDRIELTTCGGCTVELFTTDTPTCSQPCFGSYGRGRSYVLTATAPASGALTIPLRSAASDPYPVLGGQQVAVTATDAAGNTSEFSRRVWVVQGSVGGTSRFGLVARSATASGSARRCAVSIAC